MERRVITTPEFRKNVSRIFEYIEIEFGKKAVLDFISRINIQINLIVDHPEIGRPMIKRKKGVFYLNHTTEFTTKFFLPGLLYSILLIRGNTLIKTPLTSVLSLNSSLVCAGTIVTFFKFPIPLSALDNRFCLQANAPLL